MSDKELIQRFQDGDEEGFNELVKRYYPQSYQFFFRMVRDPMDAEDLCQETFLRVYKGLKKFKSKSLFSTWLYRISVNVVNSFFRRWRLTNILTSEKNVEQIAIEETNENRDFDSTIWKTVQKLPRKQKQVLILRIFQQLSFREVGGILGISENSAKVNYHHAINKMKVLMGSD